MRRKIADTSGETEKASGIGTKLGGALAAAGKVAAGATLAVAGAATAATSKFVLWNGAIRALNIEDAQAKLKGLGHDAGSVQAIMTDALSAVKGTAFGLDSAATAAANAVAAGVQPGKDLARYLGLVGDAATIANVSFDEMGSVFGKVQTQQKAYTTELNQLADRGIPIYQWLQEELGVTQEKLREMVAAGEIDSATYFRAIEKNIGGAALESGKTTRGAWENMKAAMARVGADIADSVLPKLRDAMGGATAWIDTNGKTISTSVTDMGVRVADGFMGMLPSIQEIAKEVGEYLGPKFAELMRVVRDDLMPALERLWREVLEPMIPVLGGAFVVALGLAIDALRIAAQLVSQVVGAFTWFFNELERGNPLLWGLVGVLGTIATALAITGLISAITGGLTILSTVAIPSVVASFSGLAALIAAPIVMPAIVVGAAIAALVTVINKHGETKRVIEETNNTIRRNDKLSSDTNAAMKKRFEEGKITQEQYQQYLKGTSRIAEQEAQYLKDTYSGAIGSVRHWLDSLAGSESAKKYGEMKKAGKFATGTNYAPGGMAWVGERGPELVNLPRGSQVLTNSQSRQKMSRGGGGGSVVVNVAEQHIHNEADAKYWARSLGARLRI
ncbi:tape measure protein [Dietzia cinnamea]|uniref:tape measure protein n=1 Tax=Dietzia cinnamea TaxID=321318 RepID=UPI00223B9AF3|nr:tape measure protein [Dietzia cinnamea]MCT2077513.1 tape measure protein [Dietzia cinnamea]MCT2219802.1 tape measure protein [Dietzia cinnamea]